MAGEETVQWDFIRTQTVGQKRKITMPTELRSTVVGHDDAGDPALLWYWLMSAGVAVLTTDLLTDAEYQRFGYGAYYSNDRFQFPASLNTKLTYDLTEGDTAVFLAHDEMLSADPKTVYVIDDRTALELVGRPEADDLRTALEQQPAFFGPV